MSKPDRVVVAALPHHITHRGNRREQIFRETDVNAPNGTIRSVRRNLSGVSNWSLDVVFHHQKGDKGAAPTPPVVN